MSAFTPAEVEEWTRTGKMPKRAPAPVRRVVRAVLPPTPIVVAPAANACRGCGLEIGSVVNRGGKDDRIVRHDLISWRKGLSVATYAAGPHSTCKTRALTTQPGHEMVWEILRAE